MTSTFSATQPYLPVLRNLFENACPVLLLLSTTQHFLQVFCDIALVCIVDVTSTFSATQPYLPVLRNLFRKCLPNVTSTLHSATLFASLLQHCSGLPRRCDVHLLCNATLSSSPPQPFSKMLTQCNFFSPQRNTFCKSSATLLWFASSM